MHQNWLARIFGSFCLTNSISPQKPKLQTVYIWTLKFKNELHTSNMQISNEKNCETFRQNPFEARLKTWRVNIKCYSPMSAIWGTCCYAINSKGHLTQLYWLQSLWSSSWAGCVCYPKLSLLGLPCHWHLWCPGVTNVTLGLLRKTSTMLQSAKSSGFYFEILIWFLHCALRKLPHGWHQVLLVTRSLLPSYPEAFLQWILLWFHDKTGKILWKSFLWTRIPRDS